jgi:putative oxidoreductase
VLSGVLYHFDLGDQMQMTQLLKNLALAGGYLALSVTARFVGALGQARPVTA